MPPKATKSKGKRPAAAEDDEPEPKKQKGGKRSGAGAPTFLQKAAATALSDSAVADGAWADVAQRSGIYYR